MSLRLKEDSDRFHYDVADFISEHELPREWFTHPDHIAYRAYNPDSYSELISDLKPLSYEIYESRRQDRRIAVAILTGQIAVGGVMGPNYYGFISHVELVEARPDERADEPALFDHGAMYTPKHMSEIKKTMFDKRVQAFVGKDPRESTVSVIVNDRADELMFTNREMPSLLLVDVLEGATRRVHKK